MSRSRGPASPDRKPPDLFYWKRVCDARRRVALIPCSGGPIHSGRFHALVARDLIVDARHAAGAGRIAPASLLILSFNDGEKSAVALATLRRHAAGGGDEGADRFVLDVPAEVASERGRQCFRVPVDPQAGVRAYLGARDGRLFPVNLVDLSVTGAAIEAQGDTLPSEAVREETSLALVLDGETAVLDALVLRTEGSRAALCFHRVDDEPAAGDSLRRMVRQLERRFLRARSGRPDPEPD